MFLTVPNAPKEFSSSTLSASEIQLTWKKPEGYAYEYEVVYTDGSSTFPHPVNGSLLTETLKSLLSDCQYNMTIFTENFGIPSSNETSSSYTC